MALQSELHRGSRAKLHQPRVEQPNAASVASLNQSPFISIKIKFF
jgi:hypothetical protein